MVWVPVKSPEMVHQGRRRRGAVACRSSGVVRPVRWPTHWLGRPLPSLFRPIFPSLPHLNSHVSLSKQVRKKRKGGKQRSKKKRRKEKKKEKKRKESTKKKWVWYLVFRVIVGRK
jgi:hypothetical protein